MGSGRRLSDSLNCRGSPCNLETRLGTRVWKKRWWCVVNAQKFTWPWCGHILVDKMFICSFFLPQPSLTARLSSFGWMALFGKVQYIFTDLLPHRVWLYEFIDELSHGGYKNALFKTEEVFLASHFFQFITPTLAGKMGRPMMNSRLSMSGGTHSKAACLSRIGRRSFVYGASYHSSSTAPIQQKLDA